MSAQIAALERRIAALERRVRGQFALGRTTGVVNDTGAVLTVQAQLDALTYRDDVPMLHHYGFGSVPPAGTDLHINFIDGDRSKPVVIASGNQTTRQIGGAPGDVWIAGHGFSIKFSAGGIAISGNVTITGNLTATGGITAGQGGSDSVTLQNHKHGTGAAVAGTSVPTAGT